MTGDTTIVIDGPLWFIGALVICGWHIYLLWSWRRERLTHLAWWRKYDAAARTRHEELMHTVGPRGQTPNAWVLDSRREKGQA